MSINFSEIVRLNTTNLLRWRERYPHEEYPFKVILNLYYDLIPLDELWEIMHNAIGYQDFNNENDANNFVNLKFREIQLRLQPLLINMMKEGVTIGGLNSKRHDHLIEQAKKRSNKAVEEIEFTFITYEGIKTGFYSWFSLVLIGINKNEAYQNVYHSVWPVPNWSSFEDVFAAFAQSSVSDIAGLKKQDGTIITPSIYKPLPNLWD